MMLLQYDACHGEHSGFRFAAARWNFIAECLFELPRETEYFWFVVIHTVIHSDQREKRKRKKK